MKFFGTFVTVLALCFGLWLALVWGTAGHPTRMSQWIWDVYEKKECIACSIAQRKILIVAGSNALFAIDSKMLEKAFGMPVVNYGVNAGIELPCTLFMAQKVIGKGDIVLMPLEYPMYSYKGEPGVQMIDFLLAREPECFRELTLKEQFYTVWHVSMKRVWEGYGAYTNTPVRSGLYGAHHIDSHGDQNGTAISQRTEGMYREVLRHTQAPETYGKTFDAKALGWVYLERFVDWCKQREVKVIFMPSTLMYDKRYREDPKEAWFYSHIAQEVRKRGWIYAGNPYDYMYAPPLYFNTNFHLVEKARRLRTKKMIEDLKKSKISF